MALGPGKYDALCTEVRERAKARGAVLIIVEGEYGAGFSVQAEPLALALLPKVFRDAANQVEADLKNL